MLDWIATLSEIDPAARGGMAATLLLILARVACFLFLPRTEREARTEPSRAWVWAGNALWLASWLPFPALAAFRVACGRDCWGATPAPPPRPEPPKPEPFGEDVLAILDAVTCGGPPDVRDCDDGTRVLRVGPVSVLVGGESLIEVDGRDVCGDVSGAEIVAIHDAAAERIEAIEAAATRRRRAEAAAKVRGTPRPEMPAGPAVVWSHAGRCEPGCDCTHSPRPKGG